MTWWSPERTELLRNLLTTESSASAIAAALNRNSITHTTRCAVIGKIHREGWTPLWQRSGHPGPAPGTPAPRLKRKPRLAQHFNGDVKPVEPTPPPPPTRRDREIPRAQRRTLQQLTNHTCRWPIGDPSNGTFFFCGARPVHDRPYCKKHCKVAYMGTRKTGVP